MRYILIVALLGLAGCQGERQLGQAATDYYEVAFLFEEEGCRVYRFYDGPHYHYFASCPGITSSRVSAGRSSRPEDVVTVTPKVVCINDKGWQARADGANYVPQNLPQYNVVYTVRALQKDKHGTVGILLKEIRNEPRPDAREQSFLATLFRRVVERKTDISIFQAMLTPKPIPVEAQNV